MPCACHLRQRLAHRLADDVAVADQLEIGAVGEIEDVIGPAHHRDRRRRLPEHRLHLAALAILERPHLHAQHLGVHPGDQLARGKRLDDVVVGAGLDALRCALPRRPARTA